MARWASDCVIVWSQIIGTKRVPAILIAMVAFHAIIDRDHVLLMREIHS